MRMSERCRAPDGGARHDGDEGVPPRRLLAADEGGENAPITVTESASSAKEQTVHVLAIMELAVRVRYLGKNTGRSKCHLGRRLGRCPVNGSLLTSPLAFWTKIGPQMTKIGP